MRRGASEQIWALACGFAGRKRRERLLIVLQAGIDESGHGDPDLFVLAGYVSTTERWATFSDRWQELVDHDSKYYRKLDHFHMSEMTTYEGDRERCRWFHNVIEEHAMAAISYTISVKDLRHEAKRIFGDPEVQREAANPWQHAAASLLSMFARNRAVRDCDPFADVAHFSGRNDF